MDINNFIQFYIKKIKKNTITFSLKTHKWCRLPYPNHPKGCPNYGRSNLCPPKTRYMDFLINDYSFFYLIYAQFDLKKQREKMLLLHPYWSEKKANCLLYWQNSVKKLLKEFIEKIYLINKNNKIFLLSFGSGFISKIINQKEIFSMEATGIDVFTTLKKNRINFEIKPINKVLLVNLICSNKELVFEK